MKNQILAENTNIVYFFKGLYEESPKKKFLTTIYMFLITV